jgi:hypothetical protein
MAPGYEGPVWREVKDCGKKNPPYPSFIKGGNKKATIISPFVKGNNSERVRNWPEMIESKEDP